MGQGHRVTFNMNTSLTEITKAYTSYMKSKEAKGSLTIGGQASGYLEKDSWLPLLLFAGNKKNRKLDLETVP